MQRILLALAFVACFSSVQAQTIEWDGGGDGTSWTDAANWMGDVLPATTDDVLIEGSSAAVVLSAATVTITRVDVRAGASLTIDADATLNVDGYAGSAEAVDMNNSGSVTNDGTLNISNVTGNSGDGIDAKNSFTNNGALTITNVGRSGISAIRGTFTNTENGSITITGAGAVNSIGDYISVSGNSSGLQPGTFNNDGSIVINVTTGDHAIFIRNASVFNNSSDITVNATGATAGDGGLIIESIGVFNNLIGGNLTVTNIPNRMVDGNDAIINNNIGAQMNFTGSGSDGLFLDGVSTFVNAGDLTIQDVGNSGGDRAIEMSNSASLVNNADATISILNSWDHSVQLDGTGSTTTPASVLNAGTITVLTGANTQTTRNAFLLRNGALVNNAVGGTITATAPTGDGFDLQEASVLTNAGMIEVTDAFDYGIEAKGASTFNNLTDATYSSTGSGDDGILLSGLTATVNNDGFLNMNLNNSEEIEVRGGTFNNTANAVFAPGASPGRFDIRGDFDLGSSTTNYEITGTLQAEYDRIVTTGEATITVATADAFLDWGTFEPEVGDRFKIVDGNSTVSGEFATITSSNPNIVFTTDYTTATDEVTIEVTEILPVNLLAFTLEQTKTGHTLRWTTSTETDNERFDVQRSTDAVNWTNIGSVAGSGAANVGRAYEFADANPATGMNYYRLKQMDFDGAFELSQTLTADWGLSLTPFKTFPNPVSDVLTLTFAEAEAVRSVSLFNAAGAEVFHATTAVRQIATATLPTGMYSLVVRTETSVTARRIVKR